MAWVWDVNTHARACAPGFVQARCSLPGSSCTRRKSSMRSLGSGPIVNIRPRAALRGLLSSSVPAGVSGCVPMCQSGCECASCVDVIVVAAPWPPVRVCVRACSYVQGLAAKKCHLDWGVVFVRGIVANSLVRGAWCLGSRFTWPCVRVCVDAWGEGEHGFVPSRCVWPFSSALLPAISPAAFAVWRRCQPWAHPSERGP